MQTYEITVLNRAIIPNSDDMTLVRTSVGIDVLHVLFDSTEWLGFPVTITFAQGDDVVTQPLLLSEVDGSDWAAESTCTIPHEVIDMVGPIRVTLQGVDANGRHIITAKGSPLSVEESGDVVEGETPSDGPSLDQWQQAYAMAMAAANEAQSLVSNLQSRIDAIVANAEAEIAGLIEIGPATRESLGLVQIGDGLSITTEGLLSSSTRGMTNRQATALANLSRLAYLCFDTEFDEDGTLRDSAKLKSDAFPIASLDNSGMVIPDGTTITIDEDGMIHGKYFTHEWNGTELSITTQSGTSSMDLQGPAYVLTEDDIQTIVDRVRQEL